MVTGIFAADNNRKTRMCSRCGDILTDTAFLETGVDANCQQLSNMLYSRTIKANLPAAIALILSMQDKDFPQETQNNFTKAKHSLLKIAEKVAQSGNPFDPTKKGYDLREIIQTFDWMLSFSLSETQKNLLVTIVLHLGYVGLAGILAGQASTKEAKIWFEKGRLYLSGAYEKHGHVAFEKSPDSVISRKKREKLYSLPASDFTRFKFIVMTHWPNYTGDFYELEKLSTVFVQAERRMRGMPAPVISTTGQIIQPSSENPNMAIEVISINPSAMPTKTIGGAKFAFGRLHLVHDLD
jgi:hypothetical protein